MRCIRSVPSTLASPKGAIGVRNIGDPCAVARKIQIARRQTREVREKFASLYVAFHEFSARLVTLDKQLSAIATWNRITEVQWPPCELYRAMRALSPKRGALSSVVLVGRLTGVTSLQSLGTG